MPQLHICAYALFISSVCGQDSVDMMQTKKNYSGTMLTNRSALTAKVETASGAGGVTCRCHKSKLTCVKGTVGNFFSWDWTADGADGLCLLESQDQFEAALANWNKAQYSGWSEKMESDLKTLRDASQLFRSEFMLNVGETKTDHGKSYKYSDKVEFEGLWTGTKVFLSLGGKLVKAEAIVTAGTQQVDARELRKQKATSALEDARLGANIIELESALKEANDAGVEYNDIYVATTRLEELKTMELGQFEAQINEGNVNLQQAVDKTRAVKAQMEHVAEIQHDLGGKAYQDPEKDPSVAVDLIIDRLQQAETVLQLNDSKAKLASMQHSLKQAQDGLGKQHNSDNRIAARNVTKLMQLASSGLATAASSRADCRCHQTDLRCDKKSWSNFFSTTWWSDGVQEGMCQLDGVICDEYEKALNEWKDGDNLTEFALSHAKFWNEVVDKIGDELKTSSKSYTLFDQVNDDTEYDALSTGVKVFLNLGEKIKRGKDLMSAEQAERERIQATGALEIATLGMSVHDLEVAMKAANEKHVDFKKIRQAQARQNELLKLSSEIRKLEAEMGSASANLDETVEKIKAVHALMESVSRTQHDLGEKQILASDKVGVSLVIERLEAMGLSLRIEDSKEVLEKLRRGLGNTIVLIGTK